MSAVRGRAAGAALLVGVVLVACGGGERASAGAAEPAATARSGEADRACRVDDDCVVSTFDTCCACPQCPGDPHALSHEGARREREAATCEAVDCSEADAVCAVAGMCPRPAPVLAVCDAGRCALRPAAE